MIYDIDIRSYFLANTPPEIENVMIHAANGFISKGINTMNQLCDAHIDSLAVQSVNVETAELILLLCEKYMAEHGGDAKGCDSS